MNWTSRLHLKFSSISLYKCFISRSLMNLTFSVFSPNNPRKINSVYSLLIFPLGLRSNLYSNFKWALKLQPFLSWKSLFISNTCRKTDHVNVIKGIQLKWIDDAYYFEPTRIHTLSESSSECSDSLPLSNTNWCHQEHQCIVCVLLP